MLKPIIAGSTITVRDVHLTAVPLYRIRVPKSAELSVSRLTLLRSGFDKLDDILTNPYWRGDPITLTLRDGMYDITDGRHRISLALGSAKNEFKCVWARIV